MPPRRTRLNDYPPRKAPNTTNLVDVDMEFAILETRENSFAPPTKRSKAGWPHKKPSVADLAKAGFFYQPSSGKDNVECFMCARQLDGWEKDDDPLQEHLKHGSDCAWALLMAIEQESNYETSSMEDPTGEHVTNARKTTFESIGWPHEGKRGWACKIEKMVEAGWHFAPTNECEDYTSCVYCKLSLDGWEPKDDPFEEHHRRSPDCPFFAFAGGIAPSKRPKQKKARASRTSKASRTSRLSTQSNVTLVSQTESVLDPDQSAENVVDNSDISIKSTTSTTTKTKRKAPVRTKAAKSKKPKITRSKKHETTPEPEAEPEPTPERAHPLITTTPPSKKESQPKGSEVMRAHELASTRGEPSHAAPLQDITDEQFQDAESGLEMDIPGTPHTAKIGPPEKEHSRIPLKQISPLKEQSNPPRPTVSPRHPEQVPLKRRSSRNPKPVSHESSGSQQSDVENRPPPSRPVTTKMRPTSPGAAPPEWKPVDINAVLKFDEDVDLFGGTVNGELSEQEKNMTVQEWIQHVAAQAEAGLSQEGEKIVGIFEREGRRALEVLESIQCI